MTRPAAAKAVRTNTLWNLFGQGTPLIFAVFLIPPLIATLGVTRFGALTIVWTFLNYFGLFDLGIGRALTQLLAGKARGHDREEAALIATVSVILVFLGAVAGAILFFTAPLFTSGLLRFTGDLEREMIAALRGLALALPLLIHAVALKGVLDARRRFDLGNMLRVPMGIFMYGAPLLVTPFTHDLSVIVTVLLAGRVVAWVVNLAMVLHIMPHVRTLAAWEPRRLAALLRFGGWYTVTSVVGPLIDNIDRFFINAMLGLSVVAYFTTPFEAVTKLLIVAYGLGGALFPEFASRFAEGPRAAQPLFMRGIKYLLMVMFPVSLMITAYAREGLNLWLGADFAAQGGPVLQWLAIYLLLVSVCTVPFNFLLGVGRPSRPAMLHLIELPLYAGLLYVLLRADGIRGAAIAAACRIAVDFLGQLYFSGALMRFEARTYARILLPVGGAVAVLLGFHFEFSVIAKALLVAAVLAAHAAVSWSAILEEPDKAAVRRLLARAMGGSGAAPKS